MAYASKAEERRQLSQSYSGGEGTLTSNSYRRTGDMKSSSGKLAGKTNSGPGAPKLIGKTVSGSSAGVAGPMSDSGYTSGPRWKNATEKNSRSQKGNTTRMKMGESHGGFKAHVRGGSSKAMRGGTDTD